MTIPRMVGTDFGGPADGDLLLLGPSVGTSATRTMGRRGRRRLAEHSAWWAGTCPGTAESPASGPFADAELAAAVLALADEIAPGDRFHYAGDSIGGAVGIAAAARRAGPGAVGRNAACTGAVIGGPEHGRHRAATVRTSGTAAVVDAASARWFAAGFDDRSPDVAAALLDALRDTDDESYALACEALAAFDVTERLPRSRLGTGDRRRPGHGDPAGKLDSA